MLAHAGIERSAVRAWPAPESLTEQARARSRRRVVNEALRPAETTGGWLEPPSTSMRRGGRRRPASIPIAAGLEGLSLAVTARTEEETAAATCAVLLREVLETPGRTGALVTPDPALARRVSAQLSRWGDRAWTPRPARRWPQLPAGVLVGLARAQSRGGAPVGLPPWLALAQAPAACGWAETGRPSWNIARRQLERTRPSRRRGRGDWAALLARLEPQSRTRTRSAVAGGRRQVDDNRPGRGRPRPRRAAEGRARPGGGSLRRRAEAAARSRPRAPWRRALERLAADTRGRTFRRSVVRRRRRGGGWSELLAEPDPGRATPCRPARRQGFAQVVQLAAGRPTRCGAAGRTHPRLRILGLIEARLIGADRLVLAGLEEGVWPAGAQVDPLPVAAHARAAWACRARRSGGIGVAGARLRPGPPARDEGGAGDQPSAATASLR